MAKYMLTGIDPDQWKRFKAACNIRGQTVKDSFIQHINIVVGGFKPPLGTTTPKHFQRRKGDQRK